MDYLSSTVCAYFLWYQNVVNQGQQYFGGLLYVGSNRSYYFDDNNNYNKKNRLEHSKKWYEHAAEGVVENEEIKVL